jgi:NADH-quinone oxidoreductase subunit J
VSPLEISTGEAVLFWVLAPLMVAGALSLLFAKRPVHIAVSMAGVMIGLAIMYIMLEAPFLGVAQIVVYTGAVMMLFLFVIMLAGVDTSESLVETIKGQRGIAVVGLLGLLILVTAVVTRATLPPAVGLAEANADTNPVGVARLIFGDYIFAFELTAALLITAAVGALVLSHRRRLTPKIGQKELAEAKLAAYGKGGSAEGVTPPAGPGVYARHNSADMPALDAAGVPIDSSVVTVLRVRGQEAEAADLDSDRVARIATGEPMLPEIAPGTETTKENEE